jgi:putative phosphoserine phosphatase/1-acylglycerol-3-phosphate O-acyltransferase
MMKAAGAVFIDRANSKRAIDVLEPAVRALKHGRSLVIAPEGTRSATPRLGPFKKGAFHIAMQAGVPIVPVVFRNVLDAFPKNARIVRPATIEAKVLAPIETTDWTTESLGEEIAAIRRIYLEILCQD